MNRKIKYIAITLAAMIVYAAMEYVSRGYFALGAEIMFPAGAYILWNCREAA